MNAPYISDLIGVPFLDSGRDFKKGLDCWGLVMEVYRRIGVELPDYGKTVPSAYASRSSDVAARDAEATGRWLKVELPDMCDLVAMHTDRRVPTAINHFGVCIGRGKFLHTIKPRNVHIARLDAVEWEHRIVGFYRWQK